jgi:hypothetical protein
MSGVILPYVVPIPPVTELPVDIVSSIEQHTFVLGNHALRSN